MGGGDGFLGAGRVENAGAMIFITEDAEEIQSFSGKKSLPGKKSPVREHERHENSGNTGKAGNIC